MFSFLALPLYFSVVLKECSGIQASKTLSKVPPQKQTCAAEGCEKSLRYFLYDVNPGEGFNLRRDVYLRAAIFVKQLNEQDDRSSWTLVLPPWGPLYHWKRQDIKQDALHWSNFFDVSALHEYVPVIEFDDYLAVRKQPLVDYLFYLVSYNFEDIDLQSPWLLDETACEDVAAFPYHYDSQHHVRGWFWGYDGIFAKNTKCFKALGSTLDILPKIISSADIRDRAVMIDRFEALLHNHFGDLEYWTARRSMRFSEKLVQIATHHRAAYPTHPVSAADTLAENDEEGLRLQGESYMCAHLRRQDYLRARPEDVPSIREAALQLRKLMKQQNLTVLFVATDGTKNEIKELRQNLPAFALHVYTPSRETLSTIKEGGAAIVEQIICSHARFFIGSHESTFTFRIQEEREIIGLPPECTFNRFCKFSNETCEQPARWRIVRVQS